MSFECHHFPGAADGAVLIGSVPQGDQHMTVSPDEQPDLPVLLVPSALIAANRFERIADSERHDRSGDRLGEQSIEFL